MGKLLTKIRDRHQCGNLVSGDLTVQKRTMVDILAEHPDTRHVVDRVKRCSRRFPCNSKYCSICSNPQKRLDNRTVGSGRISDRKSANLTKVKSRGCALNYQVRSAQDKVFPFAGLPLACLHVITANLRVVAMDDRLDTIASLLRKRIYKFLRKKFSNSIVRGRFDIAVKWANELNCTFPIDDLPSWCHGIHLPHKRVAMFHLHAVQFDSYRTRAAVSDLWREEFPGRNRICNRKPKPEKIQPDGRITHGIQGAFEYACLEKVEIKFGSESKDALIEYALLDNTWCRANRNVRFGVRTADTVNHIDPQRLSYLEMLDQKNAGEARTINVGCEHHIRCCFLAWLKSVNAPVSTPRLRCNRGFQSGSIRAFVGLYSNSLRRKWAQPTEFYRFIKAIPRQTFCKWQLFRSP